MSGAQQEFLRQFFAHTHHTVELRALPSKRRVFISDPGEAGEFIEKHTGQDMYFGVATREGGGTKTHCREVPAFWVDVDFKTTPEQQARALVESFALPPSIVIESGGGFHVYWLLHRPIDAHDARVEPILKALAAALGGDSSATEFSRILRLPGTRNYKYQPPREVRIACAQWNHRYEMTDFKQYAQKPAIAPYVSGPIENKISKGKRTPNLVSLAGAMRRKGATAEEMEPTLQAVNAARCDPPLPEDKVRAIAKGISRYPPALQPEMEHQIESLSLLDRIGYDRVREQKAKELGIRVGTLDAEVQARRGTQLIEPNGQGKPPFLTDPKRWESEVDGDALLKELSEVFFAYLTMPKGAAETLAIWIVFTYAHDAFQISPLLAATSPEKGCGKSTLLTLVSALARKPLTLSNITSSSLFRVVEMYSPTLLIDEADTFISENEELRGVINSGWLRSQAQVIRTVGDHHEPHLFSTWGPKAIAIIGNLPGTLADRSIEVRMCRQTPEEEGAKRKLRRDRLMSELEYLREKTFRWVQDNIEVLRCCDPEVPEGFANRLADNWRPLLAIADFAGGEWPQKARDAATMLSGVRTDESTGTMLLEDLKCLFTERNVDRLSSAAIVEALGEMDDRPWPEYSRGKPITKHALSKILARFRVYPDSVRIGDKTLKGYLLQDLEEPFRRFLPPLPIQTGTTEQLTPGAAPGHFQTGTTASRVPIQNSQNTTLNGHCSGVPVSHPVVEAKRVVEVEI